MSVILYRNNTGPPITDTITVQGVAQDLTGASVRFQARDPRTSALVIDQAATTPAPTTSGKVAYTPQVTDTGTAYVAPPLVAWWHITLAGGAVQDAPEFAVYILDHAEASTSDLCTVQDVRQILEVQASDTSRDQAYAAHITGASIAAMRYAGREFAPITPTATRRFQVNLQRRAAELNEYDLRSASTIVLNPEGSSPTTLVAETDYYLTPVAAPWGTYKRIRIQPFANVFSQHWINYGHAIIDVTGAWGWLTIPADVKEAVARTVGSWVDRGIANYGGGADQSYLAAPGPEPAYWLPPSARMALDKYRTMVLA